MLVRNVVHEITEKQNFPPDSSGNPIITVKIEDEQEVHEGYIYDFETKTFSEPIDSSEPLMSVSDLAQAELLLNQQDILINQQQQDEVLAAILLMQIGGI